MNAARFLVLGVALLLFAGCAGAGPTGGARTGCSDNRFGTASSTGAPPPSFFLFCLQSP